MKNVSNDLKAWYKTWPDRTKATVRTFAQSVVGVLLLLALNILNVATEWATGKDVDWVSSITTAGRLALLGVLTALTTLVSYFWNGQGRSPVYTRQGE